MEIKNKITIIIATHNNYSTIEKSLESVLQQDLKPNQIIIGDNDSTDKTYKILCDLLNANMITIDGKTGLPPKFDGLLNDIPITIFRKQITTIAHTLNVGINMSPRDTTIFGFVDQNSWYESNKISKSVEALNKNTYIGCVISDYYLYRNNGVRQRIFKQSFDSDRFINGYKYDKNFLIKSVIFNRIRDGFNNQLLEQEGNDLLSNIIKIGLIYHIPEPLHNNVQT